MIWQEVIREECIKPLGTRADTLNQYIYHWSTYLSIARHQINVMELIKKVTMPNTIRSSSDKESLHAR